MSYPEYRGKRVVVTGCSSGVGEATARALVDLGAEVIGLSRREPAFEIAEFHSLDLASADATRDVVSRIDGEIDALFNCAGAPPILPSIEIVKVNFLGPRLLTQLLVNQMPPGSAIASVSSSNAVNWRKNFDVVHEFVSTGSYDAGIAWYESRADVAGHGYPFSKEALTLWSLGQVGPLAPRGIRINVSSPGAVQTPLLAKAQQAFPAEMLAATLEPSGRASSVDEQVAPLLFLNSSESSYINGADLAVDGGFSAALSAGGTAW
ncbi:coniferyl-alcohol dehydrogenase [Microbacterium aurugineum]